MTVTLITDADLAAEFGMDLAAFHERRRRHGWPCVKLDRNTFRFTAEQRAQIIAMQSVSGREVAQATHRGRRRS